MTIRKIFGVALVAAVVIMTTQYAVVSVTNLYRYSSQEAINKLVGAGPHEYTMQQGLNLLATKPGCRDSLVTIVTIIFDDGKDVIVDDGYDVYWDSMGFDITLSLIPWYNIHGQEWYNGYLTPEELRYLHYDLGWDMWAHAYREPGFLLSDSYPSIWTMRGLDRGDYVRGWTDRADIKRDVNRAVAAFDTLGLPRPRGWRFTQGSIYRDYADFVVRAGIEFGCGGQGNASYGNFTGFQYLDELRRTGNQNDDQRVLSGYPNVLPNRMWIPGGLSESNNEGTNRARVWEAVALKGSWILYTGHNPHTTPRSFYEFLDSLETLGLIEIMNFTDACDLYFNTPICPTANYLYSDFTDYNKDGVIDGMHPTNDYIDFGFGHNNFGMGDVDSLGTRDSVFVDTTRVNHGPMGRGYATIAATSAFPGTDVWGATNAGTTERPKSWWRNHKVMWAVPNFAPGGTAMFEYYMQIDMDVVRATHSDYAAPSSADTVGIVFYAGKIDAWNCWGCGVSEFRSPVAAAMWQGNGNGYLGTPDNDTNQRWAPFWTSMPDKYLAQASTFTTNHYTLTPTDTVGGNWRQVTGTWKVPPWADMIFVCIVYDSRFPVGAIRISNPSLTGDGRWMNRW